MATQWRGWESHRGEGNGGGSTAAPRLGLVYDAPNVQTWNFSLCTFWNSAANIHLDNELETNIMSSQSVFFFFPLRIYIENRLHFQKCHCQHPWRVVADLFIYFVESTFYTFPAVIVTLTKYAMRKWNVLYNMHFLLVLFTDIILTPSHSLIQHSCWIVF